MKPASSPNPNSSSVSALHPNNPHQGRYDLVSLSKTLPALKTFIIQTPKGEASIDFANAKAVLCLNQALLKQVYGVTWWQVPQGFLCPPIPGRADYLHHVSDLLNERPSHRQNQPITALDIGTGANLIYPIIATQGLNWHVVGSDISQTALQNAQAIIDANANLNAIQLRHQNNTEQIFQGVVQASDYFDISVCNPPFFKSAEEANKQAQRKWRNLKGAKASSARNFGGKEQELWCEGGEYVFLRRMIDESPKFAKQIGWFTTIVSNQDHVAPLKKQAKKAGASDVRTWAMSQGQKRSHILAWCFA